MKKWIVIVLLVLLGILIGFVNGFLGAGAGMLLVPFFIILTKQKSRIAHATAIFIIMPICVISGLVYILKGVFELGIFIPVAVGSVGGSVVGTFLLKKFSNEIISLIFWVVMIVAGSLLIIF